MWNHFILAISITALTLLGAGCTHEDKASQADHVSQVSSDLNEAKSNVVEPATARCNAVKFIKIPQVKLPPELKDCDPWDYFYGINKHPVDYQKARICALGTANEKDKTLNNYKILAMIYANGYGTKQNLDLATKFACENEEPEQLILDLKREKYTAIKPFNVCGYSDDPGEITICEYYLPMKIKEAKQQLQISQITQQWPEADRKAILQLEEAKNKFCNEYINGEINLDHYADRTQYTATADLNEIFFNHFAAFAKGALPNYSDQEFKMLDQQLNILYRRIMAQSEEEFPNSVTHTSLKEAQRAWIKYREAWVTLAQVHFPNVSSNSFRALFTKERIEDLEENFDPDESK